MKKLLILGLAVSATGAFAQGQPFFYKWDGNVAIPDSGGGPASTTLTVADHIIAGSDFYVDLIIDHSWQGDLRVWVMGPTGAMIDLVNRPGFTGTGFGFSTDDFGDPATGAKMNFRDSGALRYALPDIAAGINNPTGDWKAVGGSMDATYSGLDIFGTWTLFAEDFAGGDTGFLLNFSIHGTAVPEPATFIAFGVGAAGILALRRRRK